MDMNSSNNFCEAEWLMPDPAVVKEACEKMDELVVDKFRKNGQN